MKTAAQAIEWLKYDARCAFFVNAMQFLNWERVEGDIIEFGVSVGKSLGLLAQLYRENMQLWGYTDPACTQRRVVGFDSFEGLPPDDVAHPRWGKGSFATNYLQGHPSLALGEPITPTVDSDAVCHLRAAGSAPGSWLVFTDAGQHDSAQV
jgi:hypothetical protein